MSQLAERKCSVLCTNKDVHIGYSHLLVVATQTVRGTGVPCIRVVVFLIKPISDDALHVYARVHPMHVQVLPDGVTSVTATRFSYHTAINTMLIGVKTYNLNTS